jgi:protein TonB
VPSRDIRPQLSSPKAEREPQKVPASDSSDNAEKPAVELQPVMTLAPGQHQAQQPATPEVAPPTVATSSGGSNTLEALMSNEPSRTVAVAAPEPSAPSGPLRVSSTALESRLIRRIEPHYPDMARRSGLNGSVSLRVLISTDGSVRQVTVLEGPSVLAAAAREAVSQWRYRPYLVDGKPTEVETDMAIKFTIHR